VHKNWRKISGFVEAELEKDFLKQKTKVEKKILQQK
jgi:hypothetical protein